MLFDDLYGATFQPIKRVDNPYLDQADRNKNTGHERLATQIRGALLGAERYSLADEMTAAASVLGTEHPDILLALLPRARLPFPRVWLEWDQSVALRVLNHPVASDAPKLTGIYIEQINNATEPPIYRMVSMGVTHGGIASTGLSAVTFSLTDPILHVMPAAQFQRSAVRRLANTTNEEMDQTLLGSAYQFYSGDDPEKQEINNHRMMLCRKLAERATHVMSPFYPSYEYITSSDRNAYKVYEHSARQSLSEFVGAWRFVVTAMLSLQMNEFISDDRPALAQKRRFVSNKEVPFLKHHRVALRVPRETFHRQMVSSVRESLPQPQPLRKIAGSWRERRKGIDPTCQHVNVSETPNRFRCALCNRALWWVADYTRGDEEVGVVTKERLVTL